LIVTPKIAARIAVLTLIAVLLQLSFFSEVQFLRTNPGILPAVVVALGLLGGSMTGAVAGFSIGLLVDCLLVAPLGASSLVLLSTGYLAGLYRERFDIGNSLVPPLLCLGLTLFAELGFAAVALMLGVDAPVSALVARDIAIKSIFAFFLGIPIYFGLRRALRPALIEERAVRRRPRPTMIGA
jgi:rod shape-determining protein MreD